MVSNTPAVKICPSNADLYVNLQLSFFLVNDSDTSGKLDFPGFTYHGLEDIVLTSSNILAQDAACKIPTLSLLLRVACRQRTFSRSILPIEL